MRQIILLTLVCLLFFSVNAQNDHKLLRSESFWGLHFDKHSNLNDNHIGSSLTEEMVDSMLRLARPDYIQVDSKGHPGISSYPTKIGQQAAGYDKDPLALIRKVTDKRNVALFVHHSGVFDANYVRLHPDEARFSKDGEPDKNHTSFWGNYSEKLLIPQLKELALDYKLDGVWIDGESWAIFSDYQPEAIAEFKKETGIKTIPKTAEDEGYKDLLEFTRKKFVNYIRHYATEVHKVAPDFQICSNWAYSAMMPEPVPENIGLDFLSGDYDPSNSLHTANWNARCLQGQGKAFDLMAWSFVRPMVPKTAVQLCQEAAAVISVGGGCQIYFRQNADLSFQPASFHIMKDVADFMLPRRAFCKGISIVPQVGLFYSTAGWKEEVDDVYRPFGVDDTRGVMNALLDGQQSVEVLMSHHLKKRMKDFPLIVVPEWEILETEIVSELKDYVKEGGKLLVIGSSSTKQFEDILQVKQIAEPRKIGQALGYDNRFVTVTGNYREVECLSGTKEFARLFGTNDLRFPSGIVATVSNYGKGKIGGIYVDLGKSYLSNTSPVLRDLLSGIISELNPEIKVKVEGSHKLNVVTTEKDGKLLIQLINTSGDHANKKVKGIDEIPALQNLKVSVISSEEPESVWLQPEGIPLGFDFDNGQVTFAIPEIKIHNVIEIR
ncbi:MAG: hypothetical protein HQ521_11295 [Bacteroidetes bacterium]|nr:hypothetical protein [Bacteroidota bacterium]